MKVHELKCWPEWYDKIKEGSKTFEVRKNDRDYHVGDFLNLRPWYEDRYIMDDCFPYGFIVFVQSILKLDEFLSKMVNDTAITKNNIADGWVVLGIRMVKLEREAGDE